MSTKLHGFTSQNRIGLIYVIKTPCLYLFAEDCLIYRKITNKNDTEKLQKDLDTSGARAVENGMKINPVKSKTIRLRRARVKKKPESYFS